MVPIFGLIAWRDKKRSKIEYCIRSLRSKYFLLEFFIIVKHLLTVSKKLKHFSREVLTAGWTPIISSMYNLDFKNTTLYDCLV